ncbi:hypothetical protein PIROE2DRAFT_10689 [Piromyces sp. E2]|nr:hypothetical protein PIROE2DRAFT_10689 [Piromyces sp. E2]|eukprot:OUM62887.1 hypothetical protein PIROE2DRAFT_10689 [Piromyces sp. E2]
MCLLISFIKDHNHDPSKNNNIFDYENMMGPEEQIRKQRLTEFLSCVFHDYFSNTNNNERVSFF